MMVRSKELPQSDVHRLIIGILSVCLASNTTLSFIMLMMYPRSIIRLMTWAHCHQLLQGFQHR